MLENITFSYFAEQVVSHPALLIAVLLTLGVILVMDGRMHQMP